MKNRFGNLLIIALFLLTVSITVRAEAFSAFLNGAQEAPTANASTATGWARLVYDDSTGVLSWTVFYTGLSSTQTGAHIHAAAPIGGTASPVITFTNPGGTSGTITGSMAISTTLRDQIRSHQAYINIHSVNFVGGEIRGQLGNRRPLDFDGDGRTDYSILRFPNVAPPGMAPIQWFNSNSTNGFESVIHGDANTDFPAPGDYDGDGEDDFALYRAGASAGQQSNFFIIKSSDFTLQHYAWGLFGDQAVTRDYDGDGITDIAVFRRGASATAQTTWFIRQSSNNTARVVNFGLTGNGTSSFDSAVPGDYDGDGKFDLAVYRFGQAPVNTFIYQQSSDGVVKYQQWGNFNTDYIVPGDFDGDGKFDFAAVRVGATATTPMFWWIRRSSDGGFSVRQFGLSADVPAQGDYDGDARTDIAVYRGGATTSLQSFFYVLNSLNNTVTFKPWGLGGDFAVNTFDTR